MSTALKALLQHFDKSSKETFWRLKKFLTEQKTVILSTFTYEYSLNSTAYII